MAGLEREGRLFLSFLVALICFAFKRGFVAVFRRGKIRKKALKLGMVEVCPSTMWMLSIN